MRPRHKHWDRDNLKRLPVNMSSYSSTSAPSTVELVILTFDCSIIDLVSCFRSVPSKVAFVDTTRVMTPSSSWLASRRRRKCTKYVDSKWTAHPHSSGARTAKVTPRTSSNG